MSHQNHIIEVILERMCDGKLVRSVHLVEAPDRGGAIKAAQDGADDPSCQPPRDPDGVEVVEVSVLGPSNPETYWGGERIGKHLCYNVFRGRSDWERLDISADDPLYDRCLIAAKAGLDSLGLAETPLAPGEPIDAPDDLIKTIYETVAAVAYDRLTHSFRVDGTGLSSSDRSMVHREMEAAARRAVASLFGAEAAQREQERFERSIEDARPRAHEH